MLLKICHGADGWYSTWAPLRRWSCFMYAFWKILSWSFKPPCERLGGLVGTEFETVANDLSLAECWLGLMDRVDDGMIVLMVDVEGIFPIFGGVGLWWVSWWWLMVGLESLLDQESWRRKCSSVSCRSRLAEFGKSTYYVLPSFDNTRAPKPTLGSWSTTEDSAKLSKYLVYLVKTLETTSQQMQFVAVKKKESKGTLPKSLIWISSGLHTIS
jgi:hypothetical protein